MKKISLVIGDKDMEYIESLANYIRTSEYSSRFDVKLFSQKESLDQYILSIDSINILLVTNKLRDENYEDDKIDSIIGLLEEQDGEKQAQTVFKYQPLNNLLSEIITVFYERYGKTEKRKMSDKGTNVISVYSATGGTGKSTVAFNLAKEMSAQDNQVFYLNLELIDSTPLFFDTTNYKAASPLLYYVKTKSEELEVKINELKITDEHTHVDYFNLPVSAEEMEELAEDDLELLIDSLVGPGQYDYVVIDLDSSLNQRVLTALAKSNIIFWLLNNDMQSFHKTGYLLEELHSFLKDGALRERVTLVLNRYTGRVNPEFDKYELSINDYLPYVPEWKEVISSNQLSSVPIFTKAVSELFNKYSYDNRGTHNG